MILISHFIETFQWCACDALVVVGCAGVRIHVCGGGGGYKASLLSQRDVLLTLSCLFKRFQNENVQYLEALPLTFDFESFNEMCPES